MAGGVAAGANNPCQLPNSKPAIPASAIVGTSGSRGERRAVEMPNAFILPPLTYGAATGSESIATATSPETTANSEGALPLYGTLLSSIPAADLNTAVVIAPLAPAIAMLIFAGSRLAAAMNSASVFASSRGCATSTVPALINLLTGAKSRTGSYGNFR